MRIAISGTSGTGKTTLANAVSKKCNLPLIPEFAREVAKDFGFSNLRDLTPSDSYKFQLEILNRKVKAENCEKDFIADRSTIDNIAYYLRWCGRSIDEELTKKYFDKCIKQLKKYDEIFVLSWNSIPHENDGFRTTKMFYKYEIHCLILGILEENEIPYTIMGKYYSDLEDRVNFIAKYFI